MAFTASLNHAMQILATLLPPIPNMSLLVPNSVCTLIWALNLLLHSNFLLPVVIVDLHKWVQSSLQQHRCYSWQSILAIRSQKPAPFKLHAIPVSEKMQVDQVNQSTSWTNWQKEEITLAISETYRLLTCQLRVWSQFWQTDVSVTGWVLGSNPPSWDFLSFFPLFFSSAEVLGSIHKYQASWTFEKMIKHYQSYLDR